MKIKNTQKIAKKILENPFDNTTELGRIIGGKGTFQILNLIYEEPNL